MAYRPFNAAYVPKTQCDLEYDMFVSFSPVLERRLFLTAFLLARRNSRALRFLVRRTNIQFSLLNAWQ